MSLRQLLLLSLICFACFQLASCTRHNRDYYYATADTGLYGDHLHYSLGSHGDKHARRGDYLVDVGGLSPEPGESYEQFHGRLLNTLSIQEYDIQMLQEELEKKGQQLDYLKDQLSQLQAQNADLRQRSKEQEAVVKVSTPMDEQAFKVYKVRKGDTLQKIARRELGSYAGWLTLYRFNLDRLPHGPNRIEVGQALIVPNRSTVSAAVKR